MRFLDELRIAARSLAKTPGFGLAAVLTLALGIGANTAIFSVVDAVLLETLPVREPGELIHVWRVDPAGMDSSMSPGPYLDLDRDLTTVSGIAAFDAAAFNWTGRAEPLRLDGASVSADFFQVLGVEAAHGRLFGEAVDDEATVVVTDGFWRSRLDADPDALGRALILDGDPYTVIGVLPADFRYPDLADAEVYTPGPHGVPRSPLALPEDVDVTGMRSFHYFEAVARLAPGATLEQTRQELAALAARYGETGAYEKGASYPAEYLARHSTGEVRPALLLLLTAVGVVLLIACVNVASLMLARTLVRRREAALRAALGASRWQLVREVAAEGVWLTAGGALLGLFLGVWGQEALAAMAPAELEGLRGLGLDSTVLAFTLAVSVVSLSLFSLVPAFQASRPDLRGALAGGGQRAGTGRSLSRAALVVAETALAVVLLAGAGLLARSLLTLQAEDSGIDAGDVLTLRVSLPRAGFEEEPRIVAFFDQLFERLEALPGVAEASSISTLPFSGSQVTLDLQVEGDVRPEGEEMDSAYRVVGDDYFEVMGIELLAGRDFAPGDTLESPAVAVVNTVFVERVLGGRAALDSKAALGSGAALGRRISFGDADTGEDWLTIVGVVEPVRHGGYDDEPTPETYVSYRQDPWTIAAVLLESEAGVEAAGLAEPARRALLEVSDSVPFYAVETWDEVRGGSVSARRFLVLLVGLFAALAVLLAAIGIYGVISYSVMQRRREIGIRMALGSSRREVLSVVLRRGLGLVALGVVAGVAAALPLSRFLSGMLYGIASTDPVTYAVVAALLLAVAGLAAATPATRASRLDPMRTLREQ